PDRAGDRLGERRFAGAVLADQRVDLAGIEVEIDSFDGMNAAVDLAAADDAQHGLAARGSGARRLAVQRGGVVHARPPGSSSRRFAPRAAITTPCGVAQAPVMPWKRPPARLWMLSVDSPLPSRCTSRP